MPKLYVNIRTMKFHKHAYDAVHWYLNELGCRVVAQTGIVSDRYHLGKMVLQSFKDTPNFVLQIDGSNGEYDTFQNALERSIRCATGFRSLGLKTDDVVVILAPNHNNLTIPLYAGFYLGIYIAFVDMTLGINELQATFNICTPKLILCQSNKEADVETALKNIKVDTKIITFDKGAKNYSFPEFLQKYGDDITIEKFVPENFNSEEKTCLLISTSGTTGAPKYAALTHKNLIFGLSYFWTMVSKFPTPIETCLIQSPAQWLSAIVHFVLSPILRYTRVQTSQLVTLKHIIFLINKYKPCHIIMSPTTMTTLIKPGEVEKCDFSCIKILVLGGSPVQLTLIEKVKKIMVDTEVYTCYGFSEIASIAFNPVSAFPGSCGRPFMHLHYRLLDPDTGIDILEPHKTGELWVKGPATFKGYYNDPQVTAASFAEDGWLKTGDLFYRDENWNFFFVDRLKLLLKYRSHHISPTEVEAVIINHPGVLDVAVTGISDDEAGDLAVACVVPQDNYPLTPQEIKDIVKKYLTDSKQLRGGVIFMKDLPLTSTSKVNRAMLRKIVKDLKRE